MHVSKMAPAQQERGANDHVAAQGVVLLRGPKVYGPDGRTGMGRTNFYAAMRDGLAPRPVRLGLRAVAWRSTDIDAFIASRQVAL